MEFTVGRYRFAGLSKFRYNFKMATKSALSEFKTAESGEPIERGHVKWKREKVIRGLEQAKDRNSMIPAERVWRNLGLER